MLDFRYVKFPVAVLTAHTISEKAIRFRHPDYNPDQAQKLISSSMSRHLSTRNISSKSMHAFLSTLANRQTDKHGQKHLRDMRIVMHQLMGRLAKVIFCMCMSECFVRLCT